MLHRKYEIGYRIEKGKRIWKNSKIIKTKKKSVEQVYNNLLKKKLRILQFFNNI
jgi:nucleoside 2-deoxyribosyltransferase